MPLAKLSLMLVMHVSNDVTKSSPRKSNGIKFSYKVIVCTRKIDQGVRSFRVDSTTKYRFNPCRNGMRMPQITTHTHLWCLQKKH